MRAWIWSRVSGTSSSLSSLSSSLLLYSLLRYAFLSCCGRAAAAAGDLAPGALTNAAAPGLPTMFPHTPSTARARTSAAPSAAASAAATASLDAPCAGGPASAGSFPPSAEST
eukprot:349754-Chlamydomonas_euryale.AAC.7